MLKPQAIFFSLDGLTDPLGQSQVIPYLVGLAKLGFRIHIISAEKPDRFVATKQEIFEALSNVGIEWHPIPYTKSPPVLSSLLDAWRMFRVGRKIVNKENISILHARNLFMAVVADQVNDGTASLLFDTRGFWADERIDGGVWNPKNPIFKAIYIFLKHSERRLLIEAKASTVLTNAARRELLKQPWSKGLAEKLWVIPTCADLDRFSMRPAPPTAPFTFGYVGSVGTWYLFDETVKFYLALARRRPDARMLVVNRYEHDGIKSIFARNGVSPQRYEIVSAPQKEVPEYVARMHAAAAIIMPSYSKIASAPTKLAEYLGCGVPCVGNVGVGDMEEVLEGRRVGIALRDFSAVDLEAGAERLLALLDDPDARSRCVATARELFSLDTGVEAYRKIYEGLCAPVAREVVQ